MVFEPIPREAAERPYDRGDGEGEHDTGEEQTTEGRFLAGPSQKNRQFRPELRLQHGEDRPPPCLCRRGLWQVRADGGQFVLIRCCVYRGEAFLELVDGQPALAGSILQYRGGLFPV